MHTLHQNPHVRLQRVQWAAATVRLHNAIRIFPLLHQGCQKNSSSPPAHHRLTGDNKSLWMMVPKEAQCSQGVIDCQHDRLLVSYAKKEGKRGLPWALLSCCCRHSLRARGWQARTQWWPLPRDDQENNAPGVTTVPALHRFPRSEWKWESQEVRQASPLYRWGDMLRDKSDSWAHGSVKEQGKQIKLLFRLSAKVQNLCSSDPKSTT